MPYDAGSNFATRPKRHCFFVNLRAQFMLVRKRAYDSKMRKQVVHLVAALAANELNPVVH